MSEWQLIETAPKEKSVLIWNGDYIFLAALVNISSAEPLWCWYAMIGAESASSGDYGPSSMISDVAGYKEPTHWQSLPEAPQ